MRYGPFIKSIQYGTAGKTASKHCRIAEGLPGKLIISAPPRIPAVCRDKIAVGTYCKLTCRISSPKPGNIFWQTASVASGVTSRTAGPVPPLVTIRQQPSSSAIWQSVSEINACSSGTTRYTASHGTLRYSLSVETMALPGMSS